MTKISTSKLSQVLNIDSKDLFSILETNGLIIKNDKKWELTEIGKKYGGVIVTNGRYGDYIGWDESFDPLKEFNITKKNYINSTDLAEYFKTSSRKFNLVIAELGLIHKTIRGWELTEMGKLFGGKEIMHQSGKTFVKWEENITNNSLLLQEFVKTDTHDNKQEEKINSVIDTFRDKFPAKYRTKDGHMVRSRGEVIIDNILYEYGLVHAYERKLPIEEDLYSDFYIPAKFGSGAVYIEYWGMEDGEYNERKNIKRDIYKKYNLNLIELENKHIDNLDDYLPRLLLNYGIKVD